MKFFIYPVLMIALSLPLMANQSCSSALDKAEQDEKTAPQADLNDDELSGHSDKQLPVLPEGESGKTLLEGSGPEVISPHVEGE